MPEEFDTTPGCAGRLDAEDDLAHLRDEFIVPVTPWGEEEIYLVGNSLGLQPRAVQAYVDAELDKWGRLGVKGHTEVDRELTFPWGSYEESLTDQMAALAGALPSEVVVMNGLTVNLHLLMATFYRPTQARFKVLIEDHAFPSDHFAASSQIRSHGRTAEEALVTVAPRLGEDLLNADDLLEAIAEQGGDLALVLLPGVHYYTGQVLPLVDLVEAAHEVGAMVGFDLAHAVGNIPLSLHDSGADFAAWCTYKYLNSGPGATAGCFVHERHLGRSDINRFEGWWGTDKATRFQMETVFNPIPTVEAWQLTNPAVLSMAPIRASLEMFARAGGMGPLRQKSERQITYLDHLLNEVLAGRVESITPRTLGERGCQFSLRVIADGHTGRGVFDALESAGVSCDWRHPDVIRIAPVPLYNSFTDIHRFVHVLDGILS